MSDSIFGPGTPGVVGDVEGDLDVDIAIIGAGVGGATLAWALREKGARVLVLEQGDFLPRERENWSARAVHVDGRYKNSDPWTDDATGESFVPGTYHYVGGSTKLYGATMPRFREQDFEAVEHEDGTSPAWPLRYADLEPYYTEAERLYWVHGAPEDPTEPWRSSPFPWPPIQHEPPMERVAEGFKRHGLTPFHLPQAVDWRPGGRCVLCRTCDSYSCMLDAKGDADVCAMRPAIRSDDVRLLCRATVDRVVLDGAGKQVTRLDVRRDGRALRVTAGKYVVAGGAVNSAALMLRSGDGPGSDGIANRSGQVGRNYMAHVCSFLVGARPGREHRMQFSKTLGVNDFYFAGPDTPFPLGNVQGLGKLQGETIKAARKWVPLDLLEWITRRSVDFFLETEDLPLAENRVLLDPAGRVRLNYRATNEGSHAELVKRMTKALRSSGYPVTFSQRLGIVATSHQCGTIRMGDDPSTSVVDAGCKSHDVDNLWVVDTSVFPSSAAVNPALTAAAIALRVADLGDLVEGPSVVAAADTPQVPVGPVRD